VESSSTSFYLSNLENLSISSGAPVFTIYKYVYNSELYC
jgi:hypothetical protein